MTKRSLTLFLSSLITITTTNIIHAPTATAADQSWHSAYVQITDPAARQFMDKALVAAVQIFGQPKIKIQRIYLCQSKPINNSGNLKRDFQMTSVEDRGKGVFTIYLSRKPSEYAFHGQLAHETLHLLNVDLMDAYMEGLCTIYAERYLKSVGLDWSGWKQWWDSYKEPFYAGTYKMMKEISTKVSDEKLSSLLQYAVPNAKNKLMHIDIDAWLSTLHPEQRDAIIKIINRHAAYIKATMPKDGRYVFTLPIAPKANDAAKKICYVVKL